MSTSIGKETDADFRHGHAVVGTTAAALISLPYTAEKGVLVRAPGPDDPVPNTAPIWVGGPHVTADSAVSTGGIPIIPGAAVLIPVDRPDKLRVVSTAASQDLAWFCI